MASYKGHLALAAPLGAAYGIAGAFYLLPQADWGVLILGAGLTALGGLLPDLDSDSGVPVRELFGLLAVAVPMLLFRRLERAGFSIEQTVVIMAGVYLLVRYGASALFKKYTVHRGMFHSVPAMLIAGLLVYLASHSQHSQPQQLYERLFLAGGVMIGFLSHLILDEIWAVDFLGFQVKFNKYAGSALKFWSSSVWATVLTYAVLATLGFLAWLDYSAGQPPASLPS
jgi:hypothetical protein